MRWLEGRPAGHEHDQLAALPRSRYRASGLRSSRGAISPNPSRRDSRASSRPGATRRCLDAADRAVTTPRWSKAKASTAARISVPEPRPCHATPEPRPGVDSLARSGGSSPGRPARRSAARPGTPRTAGSRRRPPMTPACPTSTGGTRGRRRRHGRRSRRSPNGIVAGSWIPARATSRRRGQIVVRRRPELEARRPEHQSEQRPRHAHARIVPRDVPPPGPLPAARLPHGYTRRRWTSTSSAPPRPRTSAPRSTPSSTP